MTAPRKKSAQGLQLDEIFLQGAQTRTGFWSDEAAARPVAARHDIAGMAAIDVEPANDDALWAQPRRPAHGWRFVGSQRFFMAMTGSILGGLAFLLLMAEGSMANLSALLASPARHGAVWGGLCVVLALPWLFAHAAHRQAVNSEILQRVLAAGARLNEPSAAAEAAGLHIQTSFEQLFSGIERRMATLDEKCTLLASRIAANMVQSADQAEANIASMRSLADAGETQREALQRTGLMISTEIMPVISRLETTVASLDNLSQDAAGVLDRLGGQLQQGTQQLKACLDALNAANIAVLPDVEKRMMKFEASVARLPEQLDATIGRLSPLSDTIADAAMLSTANIEVIDQLAKDVTATLERSRRDLAEQTAASSDMLQQAVEAQAGRFRGLLQGVLTEEASRVSALAHELGQLADTAGAVVARLRQPVGEVTGAADQALANVNAAIDALDLRIESSFGGCLAQLNEASGRLASEVGREIEVSAMALQTRLAASSTELMQRITGDTARFEALIGEVAERSASRLAASVKDLPVLLAQRMDTEIAKVDGALKGSVFSLMEQMRQTIDAVPGRLSALTHDTLMVLDASLDRSFAEVARRAGGLNDEFQRTARDATETVLQGYVDFIYLAVDRFRKELDEVNASFTRDLEAKLQEEVAKAAKPGAAPR